MVRMDEWRGRWWEKIDQIEEIKKKKKKIN
jgi:hypothetical protein